LASNAEILRYLQEAIETKIEINTRHLERLNGVLEKHSRILEEHDSRLGEHEVKLAMLNQEQRHHSVNWDRVISICVAILEGVIIALLLAYLRL